MMHYKRLMRTGSTRLTSAPERFWASVEKTPECWNWTGSLVGAGYGQFRWAEGGRTARMTAHRYAYILVNGQVPDHLVVDHLCHNRACVRPDHMRLATMQGNAENRRGAQSNSTVGIRGVERISSGKYRAVVYSAGKRYSCPATDSLEQAAADAEALRARLHASIAA